MMSEENPKFSFVMIVLNGMPFIEASLKSIYDFAYEIVIIEGAVEKCAFAANPDGSSTDGTVEFIKAFPDPENKIKLIQGKWPEKCEMQNEGLNRVTGDYLWLIDSDEVYKKEDITTIYETLKQDTTIKQVTIPPIHFWKGFNHIFYSKKIAERFWRIFQINRPCHFTTHRPPTLYWDGQKKLTRDMNVWNISLDNKIRLYHYSYVFEEQVRQKMTLYTHYGWNKPWKLDLDDWYNNCFLKWTPETKDAVEVNYGVWTGDKKSKAVPFIGEHPEAIKEAFNV